MSARYLPAPAAFRVAAVHDDEVILLTPQAARQLAVEWRAEAARLQGQVVPLAAARFARMAVEADAAAEAVETEARRYPTLAAEALASPRNLGRQMAGSVEGARA